MRNFSGIETATRPPFDYLWSPHQTGSKDYQVSSVNARTAVVTFVSHFWLLTHALSVGSVFDLVVVDNRQRKVICLSDFPGGFHFNFSCSVPFHRSNKLSPTLHYIREWCYIGFLYFPYFYWILFFPRSFSASRATNKLLFAQYFSPLDCISCCTLRFIESTLFIKANMVLIVIERVPFYPASL